jgi:hypothetical protein
MSKPSVLGLWIPILLGVWFAVACGCVMLCIAAKRTDSEIALDHDASTPATQRLADVVKLPTAS